MKSNCAGLLNSLAEEDQEGIAEAIDKREKLGLKADDAAKAAVRDYLASLIRQREKLLATAKPAKVQKEKQDPVLVAIEKGDAAALTKQIYATTAAPDWWETDAQGMAMILDGRLVRINVPPEVREGIATSMKDLGFRITDQVSDEHDQTRTIISGIYKPDYTRVEDTGEMVGKRADDYEKQPKPEKSELEATVEKMLADADRKNYLDPARQGQSFGAFMYLEGIFDAVKTPTMYLGMAYGATGGRYGTPPREAIMARAEANFEAFAKKLAGYVRRVEKLMEVTKDAKTVEETKKALVDAYLVEDPSTGRHSNNEAGRELQEILDKTLKSIVFEYAQLFSDEHSTDQSKRIVKKGADTSDAPQLENIVRRGKDYRQGKDIGDPNDFKAIFGFRDVEFGNWVNNNERLMVLNLAHDGLMDLAGILGATPKLPGLNAALGLAFGSRGRGGRAAAHFEPGNNVINLTRTKGNGTVSHEWQHAMEHALRASGYGKQLTDGLRDALKYSVETDPKDLRARFVSILKGETNSENRNAPPKERAISWVLTGQWRSQRSTKFYLNARAMDEGAGKEYWATGHEMVARGFEAFMFDETKGGSSYLVGPQVAAGFWSPKNGFQGTPYPEAQERERNVKMYRHYVSQVNLDTMEAKTEKRTYRVIEDKVSGKWYVYDSRNLKISPYSSKDVAERQAKVFEETEHVFSPDDLETSEAATVLFDLVKNVDKIMEEEGITQYPEAKDGSLVESMFYHMRSGWWPKNNDDLMNFAAQAFRVEKGSLDLLKLKATQEDFEAAMAKFLGQRIVDWRQQGNDEKSIYDKLVEIYKTQPNLNQRTTGSVQNQQYSTPVPLAYIAGLLGRVKSSTKVYDPTAGNGLLLITANPRNAIAVEMDDRRARNLGLIEMDVRKGDATKAVPALVKKQEPDVILANPPFGSIRDIQIEGYKISKLDHQIAIESLSALPDNGRAVLILGANLAPSTVTERERVFFNWLYSHYNVADHFEIDGKLYGKQGTTYPIRVLVIAGRQRNDTKFSPASGQVDRVTSFGELWNRYVDADTRSEPILVGTAKEHGSGANAGGGGLIPPGDRGKAGGAGGAGNKTPGQPGAGGTGSGVPPVDGGSAGDGGRPGPGAAPPSAPKGGGPDQPDGGRGTGPGGTGSGGPGVAGGPGVDGLPGPGAGSLDPGDIDDILGGVFPEDGPRPGTASKGKAAGGAPRGTGEKPKPTGKRTSLEKEVEKALGINPDDFAFHRRPPKDDDLDVDNSLYAKFYPKFLAAWERLSSVIKDLRERAIAFAKEFKRAIGDKIQPYVRAFLVETMAKEKAFGELFVGGRKAIVVDVQDSPNLHVYRSRSKGDSQGILVPANQSAYLYASLDRVESYFSEQYPEGIDEMVQKELGYETEAEMSEALSGYQVDAIALAIYQMKVGKALIIGDDVGVGKGRTAGALIRWVARQTDEASKKTKIPIFVTDNHGLYSDMLGRDMDSIGSGDMRVITTNSEEGSEVVGGDEGEIILVKQKSDAKAKKDIQHIIDNADLPDGGQALFTTYDQLLSPGPRRAAISALIASGRGVLVMDESHNAAGDSGVGEFFQELFHTNPTVPVTYLSATYAKRPDNMPLYMRTSLGLLGQTPEDVVSAVASGGFPLQQSIASKLVEAGQMIRRERSYDGVIFKIETDTENGPRDLRRMDSVTGPLRAILRADREFHAWFKSGGGQEAIRQMLPPGWTIGGKTSNTKMVHAQFSSIIHNFVKAIATAAKIEKAVEKTIKSINDQQKTLVAFEHTRESQFDAFMEDRGLGIGSPIGDFGWQTILQRALGRTRRVSLKGPGGERKVIEIPMDFLPPGTQDVYAEALDEVKEMQVDLPPSPLDTFTTEIEKYRTFTVKKDGKVLHGAALEADVPAGAENVRPIVIGEITGRGLRIDYSGDVPVFATREKPDRKKVIRDFNSGLVDVLMLNAAGSTGISAHASVDFKDQRQRHMIVLQALADIALFKQILGRIQRTGQVEWPVFTALSTAIPAERRPLAVLKKKFGNMTSNTSSTATSTTDIDVPDFINDVGDKVVMRYLQEHDEIAGFIGVNFPDDPNATPPADLALKVTGVAALLSVDDQKAFFDEIEYNYQSVIDELDAAGANHLVRRELPLEAIAKTRHILVEEEDPNDPFLAAAYVNFVSGKTQGAAPTSGEVKAEIAKRLEGKTAEQIVTAIVDDMKLLYEEALNQKTLRKQETRAQIDNPKLTPAKRDELVKRLTNVEADIQDFAGRRAKTIELLNRYRIGRGLNFTYGDEDMNGVVVAVDHRKPDAKAGNPYAPSNFKITFMVDNASRTLKLTLALLEREEGFRNSDMIRDPNIEFWFKPTAAVGLRREMYVITGNVPAAYIKFRTGMISAFTWEDGAREPDGIIMPKKWKPVDPGVAREPMRVRDVDVAYAYLLAMRYQTAAELEEAGLKGQTYGQHFTPDWRQPVSGLFSMGQMLSVGAQHGRWVFRVNGKNQAMAKRIAAPEGGGGLPAILGDFAKESGGAKDWVARTEDPAILKAALTWAVPRLGMNVSYDYRDDVKKIQEAKRALDAPPEEEGGFSAHRRYTVDDSPASIALTELAKNPGAFRYPVSDAKAMGDIVKDVSPRIQVTTYSTKMANLNGFWALRVPIGEGHQLAHVRQYPDGTIDVDLSGFEQGTGGSEVYHLVANYAHNNGLQFKGDLSGLSDNALFRRTEMMLSSALKFGTTAHLLPHPRQLKGDPTLGVRPLLWDKASPAANLKSLIDVVVENVKTNVPEVNTLVYDFDAKSFRSREDGQFVGEADFDRVARTGGARKARAGRTTLERAVLLDSLLRGSGEAGWPRVLGAVLRQSREQLDPQLARLFYRRGDPDQLGVDPDLAMAELIAAFGQDGVAALQSMGLINLANTPKDLPAFVQARLEAEMAAYREAKKTNPDLKAPIPPSAIYAGGKAYLILSRMKPGEAVEHVMHEVGEHHGLKAMLGEELYAKVQAAIMAMLERGYHPAVRAHTIVRTVEPNLKPGSEKFVSEMLAYMGQNAEFRGDSLWQEILDAIRVFLIKIGLRSGLVSGLSKADVEALLRGSVRHAMRQSGETVPLTQDAAYHRTAPQTDSPAFRAWFGDSKVVDADGKPMVVYHGSAEQGIAVFDASRAGKVQTSDWGRGIYFTLSKSSAAYYAEEAGVRTKDVEGDRLWDEYEKVAKKHGTRPMYEWIDLGSKTKDREAQAAYEEIKVAVRQWENHRDQFRGENKGAVYPVYLKVENPLIYQYVGITEPDLHKQAIANGHDGIFIVHERGADETFTDTVEEIIVFKSEQIKSAIGNSGTFDPENPDIRYHRRAPAPESFQDRYSRIMGSKRTMAEYAMDLFAESRTFNRYDKTVSTQLNKAKKDPEHFGRTFRLTQDYMHEFAAAAIEAANMAQDILPNVSSIGAAVNIFRGAKEKDIQAIAAPLLEGTLQADDANPHEGRVWTDAELRENYNLTDLQVGLYRQYRASIDHSMDLLMASEVVDKARSKLTTEVVEAIRDNPGNAGEIAAEYLGDLYAKVKKKDSFAANKILALANDVSELQARNNSLKAHGYMPLTRFGKFAVNLYDENGKVIYTGFYEKQQQAFGALREIRKMADEGLFDVEKEVKENGKVVGTITIKAGRSSVSPVGNNNMAAMLRGVTPDTLELMARAGGVDYGQMFQEYLRHAKSNRSAFKRLIHRKGVAGFDTDMSRILANFVTSNARLTASRWHMSDMLASLEAIPIEKKDVQDEATDLVRFVIDAKDVASSIRTLLFMQYIGGSIAAGFVQLTQTATMTYPVLAGKFGALKASNAVNLVGLPAAFGKSTDQDLKAALARAEKEGIVAPQEVHFLHAEAIKNMGSSRAARRAMTLWGSWFSAGEQFNRRIAFASAYHLAKKSGMADPYQYAEQVVEETQGIYNRGNMPNWARSAPGAVIFTFKQFTLTYIELLYRSMMRSKGHRMEGAKVAAWMLLVMIVVSGLEGLPGAEDIEDILDSIAAKMGYNFNSRKELREFTTKHLGPVLGPLLVGGFSRLGFIPLDVQGRLGMGNIVPGTSLFRPGADTLKEALQVLGPAGSLAQAIKDAEELASDGNLKAALAKLAPVAIGNVHKAVDMLNTGMYRDSKGNKVMVTDKTEAMLKMIGFQPRRVAEESKRVGSTLQLNKARDAQEASIAAEWAGGLREVGEARKTGDPAQMKVAQEKIEHARARRDAWNEKNPETRIVITGEQLHQRVHEMNLDRKERIIKRAPRETRETTRRALSE